jgi:hypothetical protein
MTDLSDIRNHLYQSAESWWNRSLCVSGITLFLTVTACWDTAPVLIMVAGAVSIVAPILIIWMREIASENQLRGDKCRRLILFADGMGADIPADEVAQIRGWGLGYELQDAQFVHPYYSSAKSPGPQRLADIIGESAFFTYHLTSKLSAWLWTVFLSTLILSGFILYLSDLMQGSSPGSFVPVAKSVAVIIAFLIAGDFLLIAKKFTDLKNNSYETLTRCVSLRAAHEVNSDEVRTVAEDYSISLLQAPPIPGKLYLHYRDELNEIYRTSHRRVQE